MRFRGLFPYLAAGLFVLTAMIGRGAEPVDAAWDEFSRWQAATPKSDSGNPQAMGNHLAMLQVQLEKIERLYPGDSRAGVARAIRLSLTPEVGRALKQSYSIEALVEQLEEQANDATVAMPGRAEAGFQALKLRADYLIWRDDTPRADIAAWVERATAWVMGNSADVRSSELAIDAANLAVGLDDERAAKLANWLASRRDEGDRAHAKRLLTVLKYRSSPVELKYRSVDGTTVDLGNLRGKVVLIDFWATWCPPCVKEVPNVVAIYQKYHDQGFEIVGISLDQDRKRLDAFMKQNGMTWPQYFDGKGWSTRWSRHFNITSVPTMWLLDREGRVITANVRGAKLDQAVADALAAR